jgi:dUTP pyrophosphatase
MQQPMQQLKIRVQKLHPAAQVPRYAHVGDYGDLAADLHAVEAMTLAPGEQRAVGTGLVLELPSAFGALVEDRSGLSLRGLTTLAGVIDPGYRGELRVVLANLGATPHEISVGDRIAQLRVVQRIQAEFEEITESEAEAVGATVRGAGGFGSTGI